MKFAFLIFKALRSKFMLVQDPAVVRSPNSKTSILENTVGDRVNGALLLVKKDADESVKNCNAFVFIHTLFSYFNGLNINMSFQRDEVPRFC